MSRLIRAELLKLSTIRTFWGTVGATLAFVPLSISLAIYTPGNNGAAALDSTEGFRNVIAAASSGGILMIVIGIVMMAGEFRFNTVTSTFLVTPDRKRVVGAKLIASSLVGTGVGVAASLLTLSIALPWLSIRHIDLGSHVTDIAVVVLGGIGATALGGLVGVGIGSLLTNQTLAITATLVWFLLAETMITSLASGVGRWFPGGAANAMSSVAPTGGGLLPVWAAALVTTGYGLAFAAAGTRSSMQRDIS